MRRYAIISLICLAGCVTSPVYDPGMHPSAPLGSKGSVSASYIVKSNKGSEAHFAALLTDRFFVSGGFTSTADLQQVDYSHSYGAVGRVTRDSGSQVQQSIGFTVGRGEAAIAGLWDFANYEGAPYMAFGNYKRIHFQHAVTRMFGWVEVGGSARISAVRVTDYRRRAGTMHTNKAIGGPYDRDTTFSGNLTGVFVEPSLFFGLNYFGIRATPQLTFAMPLNPTAFGALPAQIGVTFAIDSDILKRWAK